MKASILFTMAVTAAAVAQTSSVSYVDTYTNGLGYPARIAAGGGGIYVTDPVSGQVVEYDGTGTVLNTYPIPEGPVGIAVHPDTRVFVSREDGVIGVYDAAFSLLGTVDPTPATMVAPNGLAFDASAGELYAVDSGSHSVLVFEESAPGTWTLARMWGTMGAGLGNFMTPQAVALDPFNGHVIVADTGNYRVQVFDTTGVFLFKFGYRILFEPSSEVAWFARSEGVAVDSCGNIYVTDALMGTVRVFDENGVDLTGSHTPLIDYGAGAGQLRVPCDVMIDGSDRMYVANTNNASIEVLDITCTPTVMAASQVVPVNDKRTSKNVRAKRNVVRTFQGVSYLELPDNPYDIVEAINSGAYAPDLDVNGDLRVNQRDLEITVQHFGAATVEDFLNGPNVASHPAVDPPHIVEVNNRCGRCHSFNGAPGGMLTAAGQENLCLSCHSAGKIAGHDSIPGMDTGAIHPMDVAATPVAGSDLWDHLDGGKIRCGTCHEPHETPGDSTYVRAPGEAINLCAKCHDQIFAEWSIAGHSDATSRAFTYPTGPGREACAKCHTGGGYIDFTNGVPQAEQSTEPRVHDCLVCHATHGAQHDEELLRVYDEVTLPGDVTFTNKGVSATCMTCHNGRRVPEDPGITPHYALGGVMLEGINAVDFGNTSLQNSAHTDLLGCSDCHMAPGPTSGPGVGKVGGHTFNIVDHDSGFENVENACQHCHDGLTTVNRMARGDYDGDGVVEGVQDETQGLLDLVYAEIVAKGAVDLGHYPYWDTSGIGDPALKDLVEDAIWNYEYVDNSGDLGVKNTAYAVGVLQLTYEKLTNSVLNAYLRYIPDGQVATLEYVGTDACLTCHGSLAVTGSDYSGFLRSGHPYKLNKVVDNQMPTYPFSTIAPGLGLINDDDSDPADPAPGTDNSLGTPLSYADISYVIGGFGWKARWIDNDGFIVTGSEVQYNLETGTMSSYHDNEVDKKYNCGNCHTTGWRAYTSQAGDTRNLSRQDGLPGMEGTFYAGGIQCEACHGAGSFHVTDPSDTNITRDATPRQTADFLASDMAYGKAVACSECHTRDGEMDYPTYTGGPGVILAKGGLIRHHEQYDEVLGIDPDNIAGGPTGPHKDLACIDCHDPHFTTIYQDVSGDPPGVKQSCVDCHNPTGVGAKDYTLTGDMASLDCTDCHMPLLVKSAVAHAAIGTGPITGDIRSHIFRTDLTKTDQFTPSGGEAYPWITGNWACGTCHNGVDAFGMSFPDLITVIHDGTH